MITYQSKSTLTLKKILVSAIVIFCSGCATSLPTPTGIPAITTDDYQSLAKAKTQSKIIYDGLYNKLNISVTRIDTELSQAILSYSGRLEQWSASQYQEEKNKSESNLNKQSDFFLSFFVPERKHDDLMRSKSSWKIYLDVDGKRYEGTAKKNKQIFSQIQAYFPDHTRWSTPYNITFPVSNSQIEGKPAVFTITGALGSAQVSFEK